MNTILIGLRTVFIVILCLAAAMVAEIYMNVKNYPIFCNLIEIVGGAALTANMVKGAVGSFSSRVPAPIAPGIQTTSEETTIKKSASTEAPIKTEV